MSQETPKITEHPEKPHGQNDEPLFDNRVSVFNEKTGKLIKYQPYACHVWGKDDSKTTLYERLPGTGNMFNDKGDAIGRWESKGDGSWNKVSNEHTASKSLPINRKEAIEAELEATKAELAALKAEHGDKPRSQKRA